MNRDKLSYDVDKLKYWEVPGLQGTVGPFSSEYNKLHVYARDVHSGAGNCVCGLDLGHAIHVQAAPGIDVPDRLRYVRRRDVTSDGIRKID